MRAIFESAAVELINEFCGTGYADLLSEYAVPLTVKVIDALLGMPEDVGWQLYDTAAALRASTDADSSEPHGSRFQDLLSNAVSAKRSQPGNDVISRLIAHPSGLDDEEIVAQTAVIYLRGTESTWNLIVNTLLLVCTDTQFRSGFLGGSLSTREAIDEVLFLDPPLANGCARYPRQPQAVEGMWLPVDQPVLISLTACNSDAARSGDRQGNRSHLAWGPGHAPRSLSCKRSRPARCTTNATTTANADIPLLRLPKPLAPPAKQSTATSNLPERNDRLQT
ncbi:hypothetical protein [Nocardia sp. NBC_00511]|uniref:hypothetical protein n=1 Tax=Nocardia sp. NBC_00511 TaxID=2903591 RepID=UPI002F915AC5